MTQSPRVDDDSTRPVENEVMQFPFRFTRYLLVGISALILSFMLAILFAYTGGQVLDVANIALRATVLHALLLLTAIIGWVSINVRRRISGRHVLYFAEIVSAVWLIAGSPFVFVSVPSPVDVVVLVTVSLPGVGAAVLLGAYYLRRWMVATSRG